MSVYFCQDAGGEIKIGCTFGNPHARISTLQTGNPRALTLMVSVPGDIETEMYLHQRFAALRVRGEWFRPDPVLLSFIDGLRAQFAEKQPAPDPFKSAITQGFSAEQVEFIAGLIEGYRLLNAAYKTIGVKNYVLPNHIGEARKVLRQINETHAGPRGHGIMIALAEDIDFLNELLPDHINRGEAALDEEPV